MCGRRGSSEGDSGRAAQQNRSSGERVFAQFSRKSMILEILQGLTVSAGRDGSQSSASGSHADVVNI